MNIRVHGVATADSELIVIVPVELRESFKELVQRGANLWPDAPPEIKEFADRVTNGEVMQDYRAQSGKLIPANLVKGVFEQLVPVPPFPSVRATPE